MNLKKNKVLIIGRGQDGQILEALYSAKNFSYISISRSGIFFDGSFKKDIRFSALEIFKVIKKFNIKVIYYSSAVQIGTSFKDSEDENLFQEINCNIPLKILTLVNSDKYLKETKFIYFSSSYIFDPSRPINLSSKKILDNPYKVSKNDFKEKAFNLSLKNENKLLNLYLFPHDSPLKKNALTARIISSIKKKKSINLIDAVNSENLLFLDCAYVFMKSLVEYVDKSFLLPKIERFVGGYNYFKLEDFLIFALKEINKDLSYNEIFRFQRQTIFQNSIDYKEKLFIPLIEELSDEEFWRRLLINKRSYLKNV